MFYIKKLTQLIFIFICSFSFVSLIFATYESERQDIYDYKEFFDDLYPEEEADNGEYNENACGSSSYMWPVGSDEVETRNGKKFALGNPNTVNITSYFGSTEAGIHDNGHGALDIAPSADAGVVNVIAAQSGTITYVSTGCTSFEGFGSTCGGGYGNYVIIRHNDGNYTYYAHMHQNSITVSVGDNVEQGQVIGKIGSSGNSTGTHLHFEVREGEDTRDSRVDPLNYVDPENPRVSTGEDCAMPQDFIDFVSTAEGGVTDGDYYVAIDIGDGAGWTIGHGLTAGVGYAFEHFNIDPNTISVGTKLPISTVDKIYEYVLLTMRESVEEKLAANGISLNNNQVLAVTSGEYNGGQGFTNGFIESYKKNGNTYKVFDSFCGYVHSNGSVWPGLVKRRKAEWILYTSGVYLSFDTQSPDNNVECIGNFNIPESNKSNVTEMLKNTATGFNGKISYY